jgi:hypothetical protein
MQVGDMTTSAMNSYSLNIKAEVKNTQGDVATAGDGLTEEFKTQLKEGKVTGKSISEGYLMEFSLNIKQYSSSSFQAQSGIFDINKVKELVKNIDLGSLGYKGKPIGDLSTDEAKALVADDGFFGVTKTAQRIADFVVSGGGNDIEKLKAGREGAIKGFDDAEKLWGDKLPDIAYQTMKKAIETIDKKIEELGGKVLDAKA